MCTILLTFKLNTYCNDAIMKFYYLYNFITCCTFDFMTVKVDQIPLRQWDKARETFKLETLSNFGIKHTELMKNKFSGNNQWFRIVVFEECQLKTRRYDIKSRFYVRFTINWLTG